MVNRAVRLRDLLNRLEINHDVTADAASSRPLRKAELKRLFDELEEVTAQPTGTVADLRDTIRAECTGLSADAKSGSSQFSTSELRQLNEHVETTQEYLDATTILDRLGSMPRPGEQVRINGVTYTVTGETHEDNAVADAYDAYVLLHLEDGYRLALFCENWDGDICRYRTSAALEEKHRDPPYQRWRKTEYVTSFEAPPLE